MSDDPKKESPVPTRPGLDTQLIIDLLNQHADTHDIGSIVSYIKISEAVGRTVADMRGLLMTARKNILKDRNQLWICVPGIGLKIANASESLDHALRDQKSSGRKVDKSIGALGAVKIPDLSDIERLQYDTAGSLALALTNVHSVKVRNRIKQKTLAVGKQIDADGVLALLTNKT